jgi:hypothetical protein
VRQVSPVSIVVSIAASIALEIRRTPARRRGCAVAARGRRAVPAAGDG